MDIAQTSPPRRYLALDALRGVAMVWMTAFHFCFDLQYFGYLHTDFYENPVWTLQRKAIVSLFLLCAGWGQAVALAQGLGWPRFWQRWRRIAASALLVSAGSWLMFPQSYIYFGILHGVAVMLILARLAAPLQRWLWPLGALALLLPLSAPLLFSYGSGWTLLDDRLLNWIGLVSHKPRTEDYVPVLPWLGVMLWGLALGQWLMRRRPQWLERTGAALAGHRLAAPPARALAWLGRHSLPYYLLHQPAMLGVFSLLALRHP